MEWHVFALFVCILKTVITSATWPWLQSAFLALAFTLSYVELHNQPPQINWSKYTHRCKDETGNIWFQTNYICQLWIHAWRTHSYANGYIRVMYDPVVKVDNVIVPTSRLLHMLVCVCVYMCLCAARAIEVILSYRSPYFVDNALRRRCTRLPKQFLKEIDLFWLFLTTTINGINYILFLNHFLDCFKSIILNGI